MDTNPHPSRREFLAGAAAAAASLPFPASPSDAPQGPAQRPSAPLAMWALTGTLAADDVLRQLDAFRDAGWGAVLYPRSGLELEYLSDAWFERIRFIVEQAADRSMEIWLYDEFNWPSGHAKGLASRDRPELEAELLQIEPDGKSRTVRVPGSANLLLPEATARFLAVTHERYAGAIGAHFGKTVRAIFTDEPSLAMQHAPAKPGRFAWQLPWSRAMEAELGEDFRRGLAGRGDLARWQGWRDYWAAYTRVFHDAWVMPISRWCREHGIALSGHLLGEHGLGEHVAYYGSLRRQLREFELPGIDEIHTRADPAVCEGLTFAAIAELAGRERMVEVFALGPPHLTLGTMRRMIDLCAACGVDRYVLAICPQDLRGGVLKREYLGIHGPQQPWFRDYARALTSLAAEAAGRARDARPLALTWPSEEELWAEAGPDPKRSAALQQRSRDLVAAAREAIRARLEPGPAAVAPEALAGTVPPLAWSFRPRGSNSLRLDGSKLIIQDMPPRAALSVQEQLVRGLRINGTAVDLARLPPHPGFDLSYRLADATALLRTGENRIEIDAAEPKPLKFLPSLILWGDFAVDDQGRLVAPPAQISTGDWRTQGYPAFCGTGIYTAVATFQRPPAGLTIDTGGFPVRVVVNGREAGRRAWAPFAFDLRQAARPGRNEIVVEVTSTLGHLFVPGDAPPVGLLSARFSGAQP